MTSTTDTIEVDKATADTLKARAAERGISVADLLAEIARESGPVALDAAEIADLDRFAVSYTTNFLRCRRVRHEIIAKTQMLADTAGPADPSPGKEKKRKTGRRSVGFSLSLSCPGLTHGCPV
jgi:hypothetical protein